MEYLKKTVIELRKIAVLLGLVGYMRLQKTEASPAHFTPNVSLLDTPVPNIGIPPLEPKLV